MMLPCASFSLNFRAIKVLNTTQCIDFHVNLYIKCLVTDPNSLTYPSTQAKVYKIALK